MSIIDQLCIHHPLSHTTSTPLKKYRVGSHIKTLECTQIVQTYNKDPQCLLIRLSTAIHALEYQDFLQRLILLHERKLWSADHSKNLNSCLAWPVFRKFHKNPFITFGAILLSNRPTNGGGKTSPHWQRRSEINWSWQSKWRSILADLVASRPSRAQRRDVVSITTSLFTTFRCWPVAIYTSTAVQCGNRQLDQAPACDAIPQDSKDVDRFSENNNINTDDVNGSSATRNNTSSPPTDVIWLVGRTTAGVTSSWRHRCLSISVCVWSENSITTTHDRPNDHANINELLQNFTICFLEIITFH